MTRKRGVVDDTRRTLYLAQRTIGDLQAARRGRLPRRLIRRATVRRLFRAWR